MESPQASKLKYTDLSDNEVMDRLKHLAAQWFSNDNILLLEELFRRYSRSRQIKDKISTRLNNHLCEMKPDYDDSIVGFNEAWDIVRKTFEEQNA